MSAAPIDVQTDQTPRDGRQVEACLRHAFELLRYLPDNTWLRLRNERSSMPDIVRSYWEAYNMQPPKTPRTRLSGAQIDFVDRCLAWPALLAEARTRQVVLLRCAGLTWALVGKHYTVGLGRTRCIGLFTAGVDEIAARVNHG